MTKEIGLIFAGEKKIYLIPEQKKSLKHNKVPFDFTRKINPLLCVCNLQQPSEGLIPLGIMLRASLKALGNELLWCSNKSRGAIILVPMMPRDTSLSDSGCRFSQSFAIIIIIIIMVLFYLSIRYYAVLKENSIR